LWNDFLKHFTLPEGIGAKLFKGWTLQKMATQFQNFKKKLTSDLIKKNRSPHWNEYLKIKDNQKSFVKYKKTEIFAKKMHKGRKVPVKKGSTTIILVGVVTR
jgi:hypothetical protein